MTREIEAYADGLMRGLAPSVCRGPAPAPAKKVMRDAKSLWPSAAARESRQRRYTTKRDDVSAAFQADLFDRRRFALQGVAESAREVEDSVGCNANIRDAYYRGLNEVRRNRYVAYTKLGPARGRSRCTKGRSSAHLGQEDMAIGLLPGSTAAVVGG